MGRIEYASDASWNPITGCSPVSSGCRKCWAKKFAYRMRGRYGYDKDEPFRVTLHRDRLEQPAKWKKGRRVAVSFMGDLFHEDHNIRGDFMREIWRVMVTENQHTYLILTKRPARMKACLQNLYDVPSNNYDAGERAHIWLGVSAENQKAADERIPALLEIPAAVRWVSLEPLLESVDMERHFTPPCKCGHQPGQFAVACGSCGRKPPDYPLRKFQGLGGDTYYRTAIDWVVCGCESGPGARPMEREWVRSLRYQCTAAGVPFYLKQMMDEDGRKVSLPKMDGKQWVEMPEGMKK